MDRKQLDEATAPELDILFSPEGHFPLYCQYGDGPPQDAYIELDPAERTVDATFNAEAGNAVPLGVFSGRILRYAVPNYWTRDEADEFIEKAIPFCLRICDGYDEDFDGSNVIGELGADAEMAADDLEELCADQFDPDKSVWPGGEWLRDSTASEFGITAGTSDSALEKEARNTVIDALDGDYRVDEESVLAVMTGWRDDLAAEEG